MSAPMPSVLAYYANLVLFDCPGSPAVWHIAALKFSDVEPVFLVCALERGVEWFQCYDRRMGQDCCGMLTILESG